MKVFVYGPDISRIDPFQIALRRSELTPQQADAYAELLHFRGLKALGSAWMSPPMELRWDGREKGRDIAACDFPIPYDGGAIVMSDHAKVSLEDALTPYAEFLPLDCRGGSFWVLNVTCIIDAIDADRSEWLPVPGERPKLWREAFQLDRISDAVVFRLPASAKKSRAYFTAKFLNEIGRYALTGLHGREIWDSERGITA